MIKYILLLTIAFQAILGQPDATASRLKHLSLKAIKPHAIHITPMDGVSMKAEKVIW